ncbi:MAG: hypothetical protein DLM73_07475 [Chthoniobacterales bacterium]|nr:MAG: hypothetical protein DLM73_07475 [Chthoniobacterales bacterium]
MTVRCEAWDDAAWGRSDAVVIFFIWWKGDHPPRHVRVYDNDGKFLGRIILETKAPLEDWSPPRRVVKILEKLEEEGRL